MAGKVSVIIQTKDMAETIRECLETVTWADEIVLVDDFSVDETPAIGREYGARVLSHVRENSAAQKNWAIPQASHDWVLVVDADERVTPSLAARVRGIVEDDGPNDAYRIRRRSVFFGTVIHHCGWNKDYPLRLFRRDRVRYETRRVHADGIVDGTLGRIEAPLIHFPYPALPQYLKTFCQYATWSAEDLRERGKRVNAFSLSLRPIVRFIRQYVFRLGVLDGLAGLILCGFAAFNVFARYAHLRELQREK